MTRPRRGIGTLACVFLLGSLRDGLAEKIPDPTFEGPGCWKWDYVPGQPIPEDAKVVPGVCDTPDGRCYVVPSSACFDLVGVEQPLFQERPLDVPTPEPTQSPYPFREPENPHEPVRLRPRPPFGPVPALPRPDDDGCKAGTGWDFETFLDNIVVTAPPADPEVVLRGYALFDGWKGAGVPGTSPFVDLDNVDISWKAAPVYGNAIPIQRIRPPGWAPDIESRIGGDYWRFSQDINQHGDFWIGSLDRRYSWKHHPGEDRDTWGEEARGTLTSPECTLKARYLAFRLGGTPHGSQRVEVHVRGADVAQYFGVKFPNGPGDWALNGAMGHATQVTGPQGAQDFPPPVDSSGWTIVRSAAPDEGLASDWMQVWVFDLEPFVGERIRIRIVDDRRDDCAEREKERCAQSAPAHLQSDEFRFLAAPPTGTEWRRFFRDRCGDVPGSGAGCSPVGHVPSEPPLWGVTDVHAHPMANVGFGGHVFWGDAADSLEDVYDCSRPLAAISGPGGRAAINPSHRRMTCYLHGELVTIATGALVGVCQALAIVPFVGTAAAAVCTVAVTAAAAIAANVPVLSGATLHGAAKISSGAAKFGLIFSGIVDLLPDIDLDFSSGLIPQADSFRKATGQEAGGWWKKEEEFHSPTGTGKTHNAYQADMIRRAYHGGMRLGVWDVINSRAFALVADGEMVSDWQALKDGTDAAKRIVAARLGDIAAIVYTPAQAEDAIRSGLMAVLLGAEVDELGRARPEGLPWPRSPHAGADSMQKQVDDLWEMGIRKISPVHATNNPIGGTALFYTKYDANNYFLSGTEPDRPPTFFDLPLVKVALDQSFGSLLAGLILGKFSLIHDPAEPGQPPWNPTDWFDFDTTGPRPDDPWIGDYDDITYRIGIDSFGESSMRTSAGLWRPPQEILGKQIPMPRLLKGAAFAVSGSTCNIHDTTLPDFATSFGATVDAHYTAIGGHRNALGIFKADGEEDGEGFLRAAMKKGMLIDTDHMSQNMRVDFYRLSEIYTMEAGWPAGRCRTSEGTCGACGTEGGVACGRYPTVGVHTKVRGLEIEPKNLAELRNAYGYNDEASRSPREVRQVAENDGAFAVFPSGSAIIPPNTHRCTRDSDCASYGGVGSRVCMLLGGGQTCVDVNAAVVKRDFALPPEVSNDCDGSSKTFAVKYLWLVGATKGRGLTPSTDLNGLLGTLRPRYGVSAPWSKPCGADGRSFAEQAQPPGGWPALMAASQGFESSGVWYQDYASRGPVPSGMGMLWGDPRYKQVVARGSGEQREDRAPRDPVDDVVFYDDFGPDSAGFRGYKYQQGNRPGAQMYPMMRWQVLSGRAGWDFNLDGLQHIGLYPDLFQDMRNVGVQWEQMGPLFHSARDYIRTWQKAVTIGTAHP